MNTEIMLYSYGFICLAMIIFNIANIINVKKKNKKIDKVSTGLLEEIRNQLQLLKENGAVSKEHISYLCKKVMHIGNLIAFFNAVDKLKAEDAETAEKYIASIRPVILHIAVTYEKRDNIEAAYAAYVISQISKQETSPFNAVSDILLKYIQKDSLYCRVNAFQALFVFGSPMHIISALQIQDKSGCFFNEKIVTEGLLSYKGSHHHLILGLMSIFDELGSKSQLAIINYIRLQSGSFKETIFKILIDKDRDKELRLSAIRYFMTHRYEPAKEKMIAFLKDSEPRNWEYATVSATALGSYRGKDVVAALKAALSSPNWYIRFNASQSLMQQGLNYRDLQDILDGSDRYAREILLYRLENSSDK